MSAALMNEMDRLMDELRAVRRKLEEDNGVGEKMISENKCPSCGETDYGQHGEFPYNVCGTPYATPMNEMERLRGELDEALLQERFLKDAVCELETRLDAALEREQALAAHIEALEVAGEDASMEACSVSQASMEWSRVLNSSPETSLPRRDLIKQAEALEEFGNAWDWERQPNHKDLRHAAREIRQRAQELK